jgi:hypothetical protein
MAEWHLYILRLRIYTFCQCFHYLSPSQSTQSYWKVSFVIAIKMQPQAKCHTGVMFLLFIYFIFYYNNTQLISVKYISQQSIIYTPTRFDIFMSSSGNLHLRFAKLHKFYKLQLLKLQFHKTKMFHIKLHKFLGYGSWLYVVVIYILLWY